VTDRIWTGAAVVYALTMAAIVFSLPDVPDAGFAYLDMLVLNPDPYAALGLVFVPIYQTALAALVWGLDALVRLALRKAVK
jgi:hypothetical protein